MAKEYDCGVIIGRFQVHDLHQGHLELIDTVINQHDKVLIILGESQVANSVTNPLDWETRAKMIQAKYKVPVLYVKDVDSDISWSRQIDRVVEDFLSPTQSCVLY